MDQEVQDRVAPVLDIDDLMARCLGNIEFAQRIIVKFQESGGESLTGLEEALAAEDTEAIARLAHRIKGSSANVSALGLRARAAELEQAARQCSLAEVSGHLENLKQEWFRFKSTVPQLDLSPEVTV